MKALDHGISRILRWILDAAECSGSGFVGRICLPDDVPGLQILNHSWFLPWSCAWSSVPFDDWISKLFLLGGRERIWG